jgi:integrase
MSDLIAGYVRHMQAAALSRNTVRDRTELLKRLDNDLPMGLERATVEELADWLSRDGWSTQTRATYYGHLAGFFRWACDPRSPRLDYDPSCALARPRVRRRAPRPVTDEELGFVLANTTGWHHLAAILAAYAGLRACEIATIARHDITEETITVLGKGDAEFVLPTHPEVWRAVRDFPAGRLVEQLHGRQLTPNGVSIRFGEWMRRLGRPGICLHRLRHWYGTNLLNHGADLRTVQELMRHASPSTTAIYTQITDRQRKIAVSALPVLAPTLS